MAKYVWEPTVQTLWSEVLGWKREGIAATEVPTAADDVELPASGKNLTIAAEAKCRSLLVSETYKATLKLNSNQKLVIGTTTSNSKLALKLGKEMTLSVTATAMTTGRSAIRSANVFLSRITASSGRPCTSFMV